ALVWCPPRGAARRFPRRGRVLWGGPAALIGVPRAALRAASPEGGERFGAALQRSFGGSVHLHHAENVALGVMAVSEPPDCRYRHLGNDDRSAQLADALGN